MKPGRFALAALTTEEARAVLAFPPTAALVPVGSVEPHGPHLPLATDTLISVEAAERAAALLRERQVAAYVAPSIPYGVTDYAAGFAGAVSVGAEALTAFVRSVVAALLQSGFSHVCLVNNHLEPAHDAAVRASLAGIEPARASVACPLTRRWARTLSEEFKKGECHAGRYETSLVLAAGEHVGPTYERLPPVPVSLSAGILAGKKTFAEMGMGAAYAGAPAEATAAEGEALYVKLAEMVATEVLEGLRAGGYAVPSA